MSDAPATVLRSHVKLFDAGEEASGGDADPEGENGHSGRGPFQMHGEHLDVSTLYLFAEKPGKVPRHRLAVTYG